jgi:hypothetical protein
VVSSGRRTVLKISDSVHVLKAHDFSRGRDFTGCRKARKRACFVTGHDFSRARNT